MHLEHSFIDPIFVARLDGSRIQIRAIRFFYEYPRIQYADSSSAFEPLDTFQRNIRRGYVSKVEK